MIDVTESDEIPEIKRIRAKYDTMRKVRAYARVFAFILGLVAFQLGLNFVPEINLFTMLILGLVMIIVGLVVATALTLIINKVVERQFEKDMKERFGDEWTG